MPKNKVSKVQFKIEKVGEGFILTVKKGVWKNRKRVAETLAHLQKILKEETDKTFRGSI